MHLLPLFTLTSMPTMMDMFACKKNSLLLLFVLVCAACLAGCEQRPATAQVHGKVLYTDGSVPKGGVRVVRFEPADDSMAEVRKAATGQIQSDGSFEMSTRVPGDGVFHGKYAVTFAVWKGPRDPTSLVDEKYTQSATTPYHVTVEDDIDDLKFEIEPIAAAAAAWTCDFESSAAGFDQVRVQAFIRDHPADLYTDTEVFPEAYAVIAHS